jgi:hypothetical protein
VADLIELGVSGWSTPFVLARRFCLGDPFTLALQHELPLELGNGPDHGEEHPAGGGRGVNAEIEDAQRDAPLASILRRPSRARRGSRRLRTVLKRLRRIHFDRSEPSN